MNENSSMWKTLLEVAIRAPSPHNVQPWTIHIESETEALLFIDLTRTLPKEDVTGAFLISAMGMFLETLSIVANNHDKELTYTLAQDIASFPRDMLQPKGLLPFARMQLNEGVGDRAFSLATVLNRATARMPYTLTEVSNDKRNALIGVAEQADLLCGFIDSQHIIDEILKINVAAVFCDLNDPDYRDEISSWFRCGKNAEELYRDGLSSRCMSMSALELAIAKRSPRVLQVPGLNRAFAAHYMRGLQCSTLGWISGGFWEPQAALAGGHALLRFWLTATQLGLSLHPLGNLVTNAQAAANVRAITQLDDIWFVFKLGYATRVPMSLRRPLASFLV